MRRLTRTLTALVITALAGCASAAADPVPVTPAEWIDRTAVPLGDTAPAGPVGPLHDIASSAAVVGLGESAHGSSDQFTIRQRLTRSLIERGGFRTVAWENDWGNGLELDRYVTHGVGDPRAIVGDSVAAWRSEEMLGMIRWIRAYNQRHSAKVRVLGTDVTQLRPFVLDELDRYVREAAPERLSELRGHLDLLRVRGGAGQHVGWYLQQPDKAPYVAAARAVLRLVTAVPGEGRTLALQHARVVVGFYESYTGEDGSYRDRFMAGSVEWWRRQTGSKVVYWAANVHVAASPQVDYGFPPTVPAARLTPAGHFLRARYGRAYVPLAAVFGSGAVLQGWETGEPRPYAIPAPAPALLDATLGRARYANYLVDLRRPDPAVRTWLAGPATMRLIGAAYDPADDARYAMRVPSLRGAFDAIVYVRHTDAARLLTGG